MPGCAIVVYFYQSGVVRRSESPSQVLADAAKRFMSRASRPRIRHRGRRWTSGTRRGHDELAFGTPHKNSLMGNRGSIWALLIPGLAVSFSQHAFPVAPYPAPPPARGVRTGPHHGTGRGIHHQYVALAPPFSR
jgi:hypothetical protein